MPDFKQYDNDYATTQPVAPVAEVYTALKNDSKGVVIPCRAIMVGTAGSYTFTNPDGTTVILTLAASVLYPICTKVALSAGAGTAWYWY